MAGTGPAPSPNSRRQTGNQAHTWTDLPSGGRDGDTPEWPMVAVAEGALALIHERELVVWASIWATPQAVAWERNGWTHDVALYVRYFVLGEFGNLDAAKEARMWSDRLGLNPQAMLKNRWRVAADETAARRASEKTAGQSARDRLKLADAVEA